jgi:hypothetical protein
MDDKMLRRSENVKLTLIKVGASGKDFWIPTQADTYSYLTEDQVMAEPVFHEKNAVVLSSLRFNQGLPDSAFVINQDQGPRARERNLAERGRRTDPVSVKEQLDRLMATADAQAAELNASSVARTPWSITSVMQLVFGVVGAALLSFGIYMRWRR